uniref:Uncharacterized protein n=1 Tax=Ditylenchus dipsaci TaxID=166011 RepID=A0A915CYX7_9BILA
MKELRFVPSGGSCFGHGSGVIKCTLAAKVMINSSAPGRSAAEGGCIPATREVPPTSGCEEERRSSELRDGRSAAKILDKNKGRVV